MYHTGSRKPRMIHSFGSVAALALLLVACGGGGSNADGEAQDVNAAATEGEQDAEAADDAAVEGGPPPGEESATLSVYMGFAEEDVIATAQTFFDNVEEMSEGLITFEIAAGTESVSPFESFDPLARGVFDFAVSSTVYFTDQVPEPMIDMVVTNPEDEIRQTELLDIFNEVLEPFNIHMLGWTGSGNQFMLIGNARLDEASFSGLNVRTFPAINGFILSLDGSPVTVPAPERYSALDRGVVDLTVAPIPSIAQERLYEVSDYAIYPPFLQVREAFLLNSDAWESLSDWKRQVITEAVLEHELFARETRQRQSAEAEELIRANTEAVELPSEEGEELRRAAFESTVEFMSEQSDNAEVVERIRTVLDELLNE